MLVLPSGMSRSSNVPPRPASCTISGKALLRPPAPTSWMDSIGFTAAVQHASITCWQRRCISGFSRDTLAKSSDARLDVPPVAIDEDDPPPRPIR